jgi:hypothetical protein
MHWLRVRAPSSSPSPETRRIVATEAILDGTARRHLATARGASEGSRRSTARASVRMRPRFCSFAAALYQSRRSRRRGSEPRCPLSAPAAASVRRQSAMSSISHRRPRHRAGESRRREPSLSHIEEIGIEATPTAHGRRTGLPPRGLGPTETDRAVVSVWAISN